MLPLDFIDSMENQLADQLDAFCRALQSSPTVSVRFNPDKVHPDFHGTPVPWCPNAIYLPERPQFILDPLLHAGSYYVQDASSMFIYQILSQYVPTNSVVLDLCAAPGGKSTLISQYLSADGLLISNEVNRQRVFTLSENIQKWGNGNTIVTHNRPADFGERLPAIFDCILIDAPCSGEGMFRKDPKAQDEWSLRNVEMSAARQKAILMDAWDALRPGGILIYSTCTFNTQENEQNALFIQNTLGADLLPIPTQPDWGITQTIGYHFYPHHVRGEGFYVCALRKHEAPYARPRLRNNRKQPWLRVECEDIIRSWLLTPEQFVIRQEDRFSYAYPLRYKELIEYITTCLTCITTGIGIGEMRGHTPAPQHSLALSKQFNQQPFNSIDLDLDDALHYLRAEALRISDMPLGYVLLTYQHQPLGFVKNIGEHSNNLYPKEWRILKQQ